jgi:8-oxo-dGTP pyrophosphatase MutT (NUDIX family)/N-acetylglutamate synthase-like GNAT family acetyltransferase
VTETPTTEELRDRTDVAVAARAPVDERERTSIDEVLHGLRTLTDPFSETAATTHVTASAIVVGPRGVVLHRHKRLGLWLQPGGHIEPGESPWDAALREAHEETGLPLQQHSADVVPQLLHVDAHDGPRGHRHLDLRYLLVAADVDPTPPEDESPDVRWFAWNAAIEIADGGLAGLLRRLAPVDPQTVVVRPAVPSDAATLGEVYLRSRAHALPGVARPHDDADVRRYVRDVLVGGGQTSVADVCGVPVGLVTVASGWVEQLYLDPPWIGRGIGARLVDHAKALQPGGLQLWTFQVNAAAQRFYERHGFVAVERTDGSGNEERSPDIRYVWARPT